MDDAQIMAFCDYMIGGRVVGGNADEPTETPHSPELRAFIVALLGKNTPIGGYRALIGAKQFDRHKNRDWSDQSNALAELLRDVADGLAPSDASLDHAQRLISSLLNTNDAQDCKDAERYLAKYRPDLINEEPLA